MSSVRANSTYTAWWKCPVCTGEYQQVIKEKFYRENSCPYCRNQKVLKGFNDLATTQQSLMNEWDYVNNLLIANPTEITECLYGGYVKKIQIIVIKFKLKKE